MNVLKADWFKKFKGKGNLKGFKIQKKNQKNN